MTRFSRRRWALATAGGAVIVAFGVLLAAAPELGIGRVRGIAAVLPARDALTVACGALAIVAAGLALRHPLRPIAAPLGVALLVVVAVTGPVTIARGLRDPAPAIARDDQLRVLEWNTNGDLVNPSVIAALAAREHANVVVLPDANIATTAGTYRRDFAAAGLPVTVFAARAVGAQTAVLMTDAVAAHYRAAGTGPDPRKTLVLDPTAPGLPRIVALHAPHPTWRATAEWNATLNWAATECAHSAVLVAGDFNASVDNFGGSGLGACRDAAASWHAGSVGTWPTVLPTLLAMPIDHALLTPSAGRLLSFTVVTSEDHSGARHRPTLTVLRPR